MAIVLSAKEQSAAPVRLAGLFLLAVMAIGVLLVAVAHYRARSGANAASAGGYDPAAVLGGPALVAGTATF